MATPTVTDGLPTLTINGLDLATSIDGINDYLPIYTANVTSTRGINRNTLLGITSGPVGLTDGQTIQNKAINNTNAATLKDTNLTLQNAADITKQANFSLSGITTGTTRTYTLPNVNDTLVSLTATQTLTNKTLTSPTINSAIIVNPTITADSISGFTTANTGTIYGIAVSSSVFTGTNIIPTAAIQSNAVTTAKVATGAITAALMVNGIVSKRQGGTTGANSWATPGTTTTDTSTTNVITQVGSSTSSTSVAVTVTFPTAYSQLPIVVAAKSSSGTTDFAYAEVFAITTTGFSYNVVNASGARAADNICWIAIGQ